MPGRPYRTEELRARREARRRAERRRRAAAVVGLLLMAGSALGVALADAPQSAAREATSRATQTPVVISVPLVEPGTPRLDAAVEADRVLRRLSRPEFGPAGARITFSGRIRSAAEVRSPGRRGRLVVVPGTSEVHGRGRLMRYAVEVEGGLRIDRADFAAQVERTLGSRRGWRRFGLAFQRVDSPPYAFRVALAGPATTDRLCLPLQTNGFFSCFSGGRAVLNLRRWTTGAASYGKDLRRYRIYMVNHEVGHLLGHGHSGCPSPGAKAPVMMQQTKGVAPCLPSPWP